MPNPYKNKTLAADYRDAEQHCELCVELGISWNAKSEVTILPRFIVPLFRRDVHHIWSMGRRPDFRSNLIALADWPHDRFHFGHKGEQGPLRMLCMLAKARKAERIGEPEEFDIDELNKASGKLVLGWTQYLRFEERWSWCEPFRLELIRRMICAAK